MNMNGKTTEDYVSLLYSLENELRSCPHVRESFIDRRDSYTGEKCLYILVKLTKHLPNDTTLQNLVGSAKELCDMAVHVQKFHKSLSNFYDVDGKIISQYCIPS